LNALEGGWLVSADLCASQAPTFGVQIWGKD